jgi:hypothetical protein
VEWHIRLRTQLQQQLKLIDRFSMRSKRDPLAGVLSGQDLQEFRRNGPIAPDFEAAQDFVTETVCQFWMSRHFPPATPPPRWHLFDVALSGWKRGSLQIEVHIWWNRED